MPLSLKIPAASRSTGTTPPQPGPATSRRTSRAPSAAHRVLIVGGGSGGLELAARLGDGPGRRGEATVTLVDATLTHLWKPLLHEVAAGTLVTSDNAFDFLQQARWHHFGFRYGRFEALDRSRRQIWLAALIDEDGRVIAPRRALEYDTLIIAIGAIDNDFGTPGARDNAYALNSVEEAERFHRRLLALCARAEMGGGQPVRVVIVGGGATGVELAAELTSAGAEIASYGTQLKALRRPLQITLLEAAPRLLGALPDEVAANAHADLVARDVIVRVGARVAAVDDESVVVAGPDGETRIAADVVVWAAGILGQEVLGMLDDLPTNRQRQLIVRPTLQTSVDDDIFAIGDCAHCPPQAGAPATPPTAQAARQQAMLLACSLHRRLQGKPLLHFVYHERGTLVSLGRRNAVGSVEARRRDFIFRGLLARFSYWLLYRRHLATLLGIARTVVVTLGQWLAQRSQPRVKLH